MEPLFSPYIQYGFAGFSFLLVGVIVWLVRQVLRNQRDGNAIQRHLAEVIAGNTHAIAECGALAADQMRLLRQIHDRLLQRPCLMQSRDGKGAS